MDVGVIQLKFLKHSMKENTKSIFFLVESSQKLFYRIQFLFSVQHRILEFECLQIDKYTSCVLQPAESPLFSS